MTLISAVDQEEFLAQARAYLGNGWEHDEKEAGNTWKVLRALAVLDPMFTAEWLNRNIGTAELVRPEDLELVLIDLIREVVRIRDQQAALALTELIGLLPEPQTIYAVEQLAGVLDSESRIRALGPLSARNARRTQSTEILYLAAEHAIAEGDFLRAETYIAQLVRDAKTPAAARRADRLRARYPAEGMRPAKIALLSSFTIDPLLPFLVGQCHGAKLSAETYVAPFNSWERELRNEGSVLAQFGADVVFLVLSLDDLIPGLPTSSPGEDLRSAIDEAFDRIFDAANIYRQHGKAALFVHLINDPLNHNATAGTIPNATIQLGLGASQLQARLADLGDVYLRGPEDFADDVKLRHLARTRLHAEALPVVAGIYTRFTAAWRNVTRKCVVVDLDNTLWGGVVGEDGVAGIRLSNATPGSEYAEFQGYLKSLLSHGFVLAIASKNNAQDALEVFHKHDAMVLREADFVATRINWNPKPDNIRSIAQELGIGLDSIIFVDDNPDERALMRQMLPEVLTVELPADASRYRSTLSALPELQTLRVTDEDRQRTQLYRARREREDARSSATSIADFLTSLKLKVDIDLVDEASTSRVHQLFQRTNQFNLTTKRYEKSTVEARRADAAWRVYTVRARDRFSDHELVGAAMVELRGDAWHVENFVLSCRVIGYGIETALLNTVTSDAILHGASLVTGSFIQSAKNAPAQSFYAQHGFASIEFEGPEQLWRLEIDKPVDAPAWIAIERKHES